MAKRKSAKATASPITAASYHLEIDNDPAETIFVLQIIGTDGVAYSAPDRLASDALEKLGSVWPKANVQFYVQGKKIVRFV